MRFWFALLSLATTTGCVSNAHPAGVPSDAPTFDPIAFFAGRTEGRGSLKVVFKHRQPTLFEGRGTVAPDGSLTLVQQVRRGKADQTERTWHLHATMAGHYAGTLSDASGPVSGDVNGNGLHLRFGMKGGLQAEQWLYPQPGGEVVQNSMVISKFGLPVARFEERITRIER